MDKLISVVAFLVNDKFIFPLFEVLFIALFFYALAKERRWLPKKPGSTASVERGKEGGWDYFQLAYGVITIVLLQFINSAEALKGYKTIISLVDIFMWTYLAFFNSWFRDEIIRFVVNSQKKKD